MNEPTDNIYFYPVYLLILVIFYFVLKSPKKSDEKRDTNSNENSDSKKDEKK